MKKTKALNLVSKLDNYKKSVCLGIRNLCVPFSNNLANRDHRMIKVKIKVFRCFPSEDGTHEYYYNHELHGTAHKRKINVFNEIPEVYWGNLDIIFNKLCSEQLQKSMEK